MRRRDERWFQIYQMVYQTGKGDLTPAALVRRTNELFNAIRGDEQLAGREFHLPTTPCGLVMYSIGPGKQVYIDSNPQIAILTRRLIVDPACAPYFDIVDLKAGQRSLFISCDRLAASLFPPVENVESEIGRIHVEAVYPGAHIRIIVQNKSTETRDFMGAVMCSLLQEDFQ